MTAPVAVRRTGPDWSATPALATAAAVSLLGVAAGVEAAVLVAWLVPVMWAAVVDARSSRLPDRLTLVGAAVFGVVLVAAVEGSGSLLVRAALGGVLLGVPFLVMHLVSPAGFGFGDVKYGLLVGLGLGVVGPGLALVNRPGIRGGS